MDNDIVNDFVEQIEVFSKNYIRSIKGHCDQNRLWELCCPDCISGYINKEDISLIEGIATSLEVLPTDNISNLDLVVNKLGLVDIDGHAGRLLKHIRLTDYLKNSNGQAIKEAIQEVFDHWDTAKITPDAISVITRDDVILKDTASNLNINFGKFEIYFQIDTWKGQLQSSPLHLEVRVRPITPLYVGLSYHPHVNGNFLCCGGGNAAVTRAILDIRLVDYFDIITAILNTYNSASPYLALNKWAIDIICIDCDAVIQERDNRHMCSSCKKRLCQECVNTGCSICKQSCCFQCHKNITQQQCVHCKGMHCAHHTHTCPCCEKTECGIYDNYTTTECGSLACQSCSIQCHCCDHRFCKCGCVECYAIYTNAINSEIHYPLPPLTTAMNHCLSCEEGTFTCFDCLSECNNCGSNVCSCHQRYDSDDDTYKCFMCYDEEAPF